MRTAGWLVAGMIGPMGGYASAQTTRQMAALAVGDKAPTDKPIDLTAEDLVAVVTAMPGRNLATARAARDVRSPLVFMNLIVEREK